MKKKDTKESPNILDLLKKQSQFSGSKGGFGAAGFKTQGSKFIPAQARITQNKGSGGK